MVSGGMIWNFPVTPVNLKVSNTVFGPDAGSIRGKAVRRKPDPVMKDYVMVPSEIIERNSWLEVSSDIMYVNQIHFFITVGHWVKFITAENLTNRRARTLLNGLYNVYNIYLKQDFKLDTLYMDNEFEVLMH